MVYLEAFGGPSLIWTHGLAHRGNLLGIYSILLVIIFIGGRVIPFFTESSVARSQPRTWPFVEFLSHLTAVLFLVCQVLFEPGLLTAWVSIISGGVHLIRLMGWQVRRIRRISLVWVLHLGYLWLVLGFFLSGLSSIGLLPAVLPLHAFAIGGVSLIILGMISRVSLGHTGRRLHPSIWIVVSYVLVCLSAIVRVFIPWFLPEKSLLSYGLSATGWGVAFSLFCVIYVSILFYPRVDGRPG